MIEYVTVCHEEGGRGFLRQKDWYVSMTTSREWVHNGHGQFDFGMLEIHEEWSIFFLVLPKVII